ncbi:hypothetical protein NBRC116584_11870 [Hydrogenophaga sp. 5NK40-0174]
MRAPPFRPAGWKGGWGDRGENKEDRRKERFKRTSEQASWPQLEKAKKKHHFGTEGIINPLSTAGRASNAFTTLAR